MTGHRSATGNCMRGVVIVTLILLAAVGFCVLEGEHDTDHHAGAVHLCLATVSDTLARFPVVTLLVAGSAVMMSLHRLTMMSLGVPVPPPKLRASL
jgi:hypothetical protein